MSVIRPNLHSVTEDTVAARAPMLSSASTGATPGSSRAPPSAQQGPPPLPSRANSNRPEPLTATALPHARGSGPQPPAAMSPSSATKRATHYNNSSSGGQGHEAGQGQRTPRISPNYSQGQRPPMALAIAGVTAAAVIPPSFATQAAPSPSTPNYSGSTQHPHGRPGSDSSNGNGQTIAVMREQLISSRLPGRGGQPPSAALQHHRRHQHAQQQQHRDDLHNSTSPNSPALDRSGRAGIAFATATSTMVLLGGRELGPPPTVDFHLPTPCTADEIRLLSPLAALKEHFDALRAQHERGENLLHNRIQAQTVILRASMAMAFHHVDALLLNEQLVVLESPILREMLMRASELWHRDDAEHLDDLGDVIHDLDGFMKERVSLMVTTPVVRLSRLSGLWLMLVSREAHFSTRILTIGVIAVVQIALLIINVATGDSTQLILSVILFATCICTYVFLALLVQHATVFSHMDILRSMLSPDVEWLAPDDLLADAPITWYRRSLLFGTATAGATNVSSPLWDSPSHHHNQHVSSTSGGHGSNALPSFSSIGAQQLGVDRGAVVHPTQFGASGCDTVVSSRLLPRQRPCLLQPQFSGSSNGALTNAAAHGITAAGGGPSAPTSGVSTAGTSPSIPPSGAFAVALRETAANSVHTTASSNQFSVLLHRNSSGHMRGGGGGAESESLRNSTISTRLVGGGASGGNPLTAPLLVALPILDMVRQKRVSMHFGSDLFATFAPLIVVQREKDEIITVTDAALEMTSSSASQVIGTKVSRVFSVEYVGPAKANSSCRPVVLRFHHGKRNDSTSTGTTTTGTGTSSGASGGAGVLTFHAVQCVAKGGLPSAAAVGNPFNAGGSMAALPSMTNPNGGLFQKSATSSSAGGAGGLRYALANAGAAAPGMHGGGQHLLPLTTVAGGSTAAGFGGTTTEDVVTAHTHNNNSSAISVMSWAPQWNDESNMLVNFGASSGHGTGQVSAHASIAQMFHNGNNQRHSRQFDSATEMQRLAGNNEPHRGSTSGNGANATAGMKDAAGGGGGVHSDTRHYVIYLLVDRVGAGAHHPGIVDGSRTTNTILAGFSGDGGVGVGRRSANDPASLSDVMTLRFPPQLGGASLMSLHHGPKSLRDSVASATNVNPLQHQVHRGSGVPTHSPGSVTTAPQLSGSSKAGSPAAGGPGSTTHVTTVGIPTAASSGSHAALFPAGPPLADDQTKEVLRRAIIATAPSADIRFAQTFPALALDQLPVSTISRVIRTLVSAWAEDPTFSGIVIFFDHEEMHATTSSSTALAQLASSGSGAERGNPTSSGSTTAGRTQHVSGGGGDVTPESSIGSGFSDGSAANTPTPSGGSRGTAHHTTRNTSVVVSHHRSIIARITPELTITTPSHRAGGAAATANAIAARAAAMRSVHDELSDILRAAGVMSYAFDDRTQNCRLQWAAPLRMLTTAAVTLLGQHSSSDGATATTQAAAGSSTTSQQQLQLQQQLQQQQSRRQQHGDGPLQLPSLLAAGGPGLHSHIVDDMHARRRKHSSATAGGGSGEFHSHQSPDAATQQSLRVLFFSTADVQTDAVALGCLFQAGILVTYIPNGDLESLVRRIRGQYQQQAAVGPGAARWLGVDATTGSSDSLFDLLLVDWDPRLNDAAAEMGSPKTLLSTASGGGAPGGPPLRLPSSQQQQQQSAPLPEVQLSFHDDPDIVLASPSSATSSQRKQPWQSPINHAEPPDDRKVVLSYLAKLTTHQHHATFVFSRKGRPEPSRTCGVSGSAILTTEWNHKDHILVDGIIQPLLHAVSRYLPMLRQAATGLSGEGGGVSDGASPPHGRGGARAELIGVGSNGGGEVLSRNSRLAPTYTLGRRLGAGGFGDVFEVRLGISGGVLAMKRIFAQEDAVFDEIRREVDLMASLVQHKNIVQLSHCTVEDQCVCLFMELCDGSLSQLLRPFQVALQQQQVQVQQLLGPNGYQSPNQTPTLALACSNSTLTSLQMVQIINDILCGLRFLHHQGIAHRDLKPENVLFRDGVAKISDFGSAARDRGEIAPFKTMKGTLSYMAPEIVLGEHYGKSCDVWSMGCILAELIGVPLLHLHNLTVPKLTEYFASLGMEDSVDVQEIPGSIHLAMSGSGGRVPELGATRSPVPRGLDNSMTASPPTTRSPQAHQTRMALPSDVVVLLRGCFARDPQRRLTVDDLMAHPVAFDEVWLTQMRLAVAERLPKELVATTGTTGGQNGALIQFHSMDMSLDSLGGTAGA